MRRVRLQRCQHGAEDKLWRQTVSVFLRSLATNKTDKAMMEKTRSQKQSLLASLQVCRLLCKRKTLECISLLAEDLEFQAERPRLNLRDTLSFKSKKEMWRRQSFRKTHLKRAPINCVKLEKCTHLWKVLDATQREQTNATEKWP